MEDRTEHKGNTVAPFVFLMKVETCDKGFKWKKSMENKKIEESNKEHELLISFTVDAINKCFVEEEQ